MGHHTTILSSKANHGARTHLCDDGVALAELGLQVLLASQADKLAVDHNSDACAQRFTLFHAGTNIEKKIFWGVKLQIQSNLS
jgi:hypothetical protein